MLARQVICHYERNWGPPSRRASFSHDTGSIRVFKWSADRTSEGVALYATIGASDRIVDHRHRDHRVEYILGLLPEQDDAASPLSRLGSYGDRSGSSVLEGDTLSFTEPLWPGSELCALLVMRSREPLLPLLSTPDGPHVEFLQAIPLHATEVDAKSRLGSETLLARWEEARVPFWDPMRAPSVPH